MKMTRALVVAAVLGFGSLVGCGGTEVADSLGEDSQQTVEQALCSPISGATAVPSGTTCIYEGSEFHAYKVDGLGCYLYKCTGSTWSYKRSNENNSGCTDIVNSSCTTAP